MITCPDCEENFDMPEDAEIGQVLECPKCHARLELLNLFPVQIDYASEPEE